jgi:hypothetical protein
LSSGLGGAGLAAGFASSHFDLKVRMGGNKWMDEFDELGSSNG